MRPDHAKPARYLSDPRFLGDLQDPDYGSLQDLVRRRIGQYGQVAEVDPSV